MAGVERQWCHERWVVFRETGGVRRDGWCREAVVSGDTGSVGRQVVLGVNKLMVSR